jgi:phosphoribosylaminoimidazolecarboxamide formyltransferase/IMP cyclohydrolase
MKKYALISVFDKAEVETISKFLSEEGYQIISTGGTAKYLIKKGIEIVSLDSITGFPEVFDGRVKTLNPKIFGGILYRRGMDNKVKEKHEIPSIDIVIVNFYPFEHVLEKKLSFEEMIENIDIGGPSMVRAAAKNFKDVIIITDPEDYKKFIDNYKKNNGKISFETRKSFAAKAFLKTAYYDSLIFNYLNDKKITESDFFVLGGRKETDLRYGENPHQTAALYSFPPESYIKGLNQLQGKKLSYNNIKDVFETMSLVAEFKNDTFCAITKHNNSCGAALGDSVKNSFLRALEGDPISAFGGIIGFTEKVDKETAEEIVKSFFEVVIAPDFDEEALSVFKKKKNLRILKQKKFPTREFNISVLDGGFLLQEEDKPLWVKENRYEQVSGEKISEKTEKDLEFSFKIVKHLKSNAICIVKEGKLITMGTGFTSRIDALKFAINRVKDKTVLKNSTMASSAFFPFSDSVEFAHEYGIKNIIQPGGSIRDREVIEKAVELKMNMFLTGIRHFKH